MVPVVSVDDHMLSMDVAAVGLKVFEVSVDYLKDMVTYFALLDFNLVLRTALGTKTLDLIPLLVDHPTLHVYLLVIIGFLVAPLRTSKCARRCCGL